jgi:hypothetical protein
LNQLNQRKANAMSVAVWAPPTGKRTLSWIIALVTVLLLVLMLALCDGDLATRYSVRLSLLWYAVAYTALLARSDDRWQRITVDATSKSCDSSHPSCRSLLAYLCRDFRSLRMIRWYWTLGLICYLVHVAVAFHYFHQWSHDVAVEYTQRTSGFGSGIYASYLFSLVWLADVLLAWISPRKYANRNRFQTYAVHLFLIFMVFNGAIVFANGPTRWISLAVFFGILAYSWFGSHQRRFAKWGQ